MEEFRPFEDKEKIEELRKERDALVESLSKFNIPSSEKAFITRRINYITEKLLQAARYGK